MKTAIILGTRPEIIKMAPIIREYKKGNSDFIVLHTGQHYSYELDKTFFKDLDLDDPDYNLNVGSSSHGVQTAKILTGIEEIIKDDCDLVLVQGDTNTVLGGALAASKLNIPVGHVEAGLRSWDRSMPEEINRVITDHISDFLFAPTKGSKNNLLKEGIPESSIYVTGNTVVDAVYQNMKIAENKRDPLSDLGIKENEYLLVTAHRAENTDNRERLGGILKTFNDLSAKYNIPVIYPIHPRTEKMVQQFGFKMNNIQTIPPVGYLDFLILEAKSRLILTDSGGVQEEACILGIPCVTLRENTERPETVDVGANMLAGTEPRNIMAKVNQMLQVEKKWKNPFGKGDSGKQIKDILINYFN